MGPLLTLADTLALLTLHGQADVRLQPRRHGLATRWRSTSIVVPRANTQGGEEVGIAVYGVNLKTVTAVSLRPMRCVRLC